MVAVWHGHSAIVEVLLRAGADVNAINEAGICALTLAVVKHPTLIRLLATSTCQLNIQDKEVGGRWTRRPALSCTQLQRQVYNIPTRSWVVGLYFSVNILGYSELIFSIFIYMRAQDSKRKDSFTGAQGSLL